MTHHTDAELLRDIEEHMRKMWDARLLPAVCWPADLAQRLTQAVRRAPAAPVPQGWKPVPEAITDAMLIALIEGAFCRVTNESAKDFRRAWAGALAAAPQPPEAAPAQLPEPVAVMTDTTPREPGWKTMFVPDSGTRLYTEHQVRQLLAAHGIKEQST